MAESDVKELILRLLVQIPDAKIPPLDTREAEAALERLRQRARETLAEIQGAAARMPGAMVPGGAGPVMPVIQPGRPTVYQPYQPGGFPMPAVPPGGLFVNPNQYGLPIGPAPRPYGPFGVGASPIYPQGAATLLSGPWYGSNYMGPGGPTSRVGAYAGLLSYGGAHHGPISDGGSAGVASLTSARGYDMALIRDHAEQIRSLQQYEGNVQKLAAAMRNVREASVSAAAGLVLLNKSMQEGSGFDNWYTMATGGVMVGDSALRLGAAAPNLVRGGAGLAANAFGTAAGYAGGGLASRGLVSAGGYFRNIAGARGVLGLARAASGPIAIATTAATLGYDLYDAHRDNRAAIARGRDLDAQIWQQQFDARNRGEFYAGNDALLRNQYGAARDAVIFGGRMGSFDSMSGLFGESLSFAMSRGRWGDVRRLEGQLGGLAQDRALEVGAYIRANDAHLRGLDSQRVELSGRYDSAMSGGRFEDAKRFSEQLIALDRQRADLGRQNSEAWRSQLQYMGEALQVSSQIARTELSRAETANRGVGSRRDRDWNRGINAYRRAMGDGQLDDREAAALERVGFGDSRDLQDFYRRRGQSRADAASRGGYSGLLPEDTRTSQEIAKLEATIKKLEADRGRLVSEFAKFGETEGRLFDSLLRSTEQHNRRLSQLEAGATYSRR